MSCGKKMVSIVDSCVTPSTMVAEVSATVVSEGVEPSFITRSLLRAQTRGLRLRI